MCFSILLSTTLSRSINFIKEEGLDSRNMKFSGLMSRCIRPETTLGTSGEDVRTTLETSGEDVRNTPEMSGEDVRTTLETSG